MFIVALYEITGVDICLDLENDTFLLLLACTMITLPCGWEIDFFSSSYFEEEKVLEPHPHDLLGPGGITT